MKGWFKGKTENALVLMPQSEVAQRTASIDPNGNSAIHQGVAQQVASLGPNQSFDIEHSVTENGAKISFSKRSHPPMVSPMMSAPIHAQEGATDDIRSLEKQLKKLRHELERAKFTHLRDGPRMDVNGVPCMLVRGTNGGYDLMKIGPTGQLEFMCHLGERP